MSKQSDINISDERVEPQTKKTLETKVKNKTLVNEIPYKNAQTEFEQYGPNVVSVVLLFLLIAAGILVYIKKFLDKKPAASERKQINILEKTKINARTNLLLVECKNKVFLCSQTMDQVNLIAEIDNQNDE